ncbi:MAG: HypC/HybG/HupF family hydrogenase formation chaperone [Candidatus Latescibacteria bacterium]|jgi:hydrogenase expression/formation protein HypC|nr:HypC/HybG/HupF family hydrogenase formation chaperone [Candidatus Latescibacterota bacterium]MBT4136496.1 HypC/HybG/HupF family hydrogenase formation chaperone [Candidatus Latescibacterota bacterium]MBT5831533.1 HypC/HybG/HupF family hydrogenase formation chaperone [Candidatus Latescibacterota bacterium]
MCLGIPGKLEKFEEMSNGQQMGKVSFGGVMRSVCLDFVPEVEVGQYVLVHVGFALSCLDAAEAEKTMAILKEIEAVGEVLEGTQ